MMLSLPRAVRIAPGVSGIHSPALALVCCVSGDEQVEKAYKSLISTVEELDRTASVGMKSGLKDDKEIVALYEKCVEQGNLLISTLP